MYYIGIDLGTSAIKLLLMDEEGKILKSTSRPSTSSFPHPGWSEQDPAQWYDLTCDGLGELTRDVEASSVKAISFAGQMHGLVCLDPEDRLIRPAILWNDGRTGSETNQLNSVIGKQNLVDYTSNIAFAGFTAPKLLWMRVHEPELYSRINKIMLPKDYMVYRLTGVHATDYSDASGTLLLDVKQRGWSEEMLDICGIDINVMPQLYASHQVVGTLTASASRDTGLGSETLVVAGAADNAAAAIGTGTIGHNRCNISLGTSGTIFIAGDTFRPDPDIPVHCFIHADGGQHLLGCMLSAASCYQWWREDILDTKDYDSESEYVIKLGENSIFFLPYLMGERTPWNDPKVRGAFIGLSRETSRSQMSLAVMEGVAFGIKDGLQAAEKLGADITTSTICGGGARSPLWRRIMTNVLDLPLTTIVGEEGPGFGAAILAAVGAGAYPSIEAATKKLVEYGETIYPNPETVKKYEDRYEVYRSIYPAVKDLY